MKAVERQRCTQFFALRQKGGTSLADDVLTQCLKEAGTHQTHKAKKPGGVVYWKEAKHGRHASHHERNHAARG